MSNCSGSAASHGLQVFGAGNAQGVNPLTGAIATHPLGGTYVGGKKRRGSKKSKVKGKSKGKKGTKGRKAKSRGRLCNWLRFGGQRGGDCGCSGGDASILPKFN
jgi:hypothetical protein